MVEADWTKYDGAELVLRGSILAIGFLLAAQLNIVSSFVQRTRKNVHHVPFIALVGAALGITNILVDTLPLLDQNLSCNLGIRYYGIFAVNASSTALFVHYLAKARVIRITPSPSWTLPQIVFLLVIVAQITSFILYVALARPITTGPRTCNLEPPTWVVLWMGSVFVLNHIIAGFVFFLPLFQLGYIKIRVPEWRPWLTRRTIPKMRQTKQDDESGIISESQPEGFKNGPASRSGEVSNGGYRFSWVKRCRGISTRDSETPTFSNKNLSFLMWRVFIATAMSSFTTITISVITLVFFGDQESTADSVVSQTLYEVALVADWAWSVFALPLPGERSSHDSDISLPYQETTLSTSYQEPRRLTQGRATATPVLGSPPCTPRSVTENS